MKLTTNQLPDTAREHKSEGLTELSIAIAIISTTRYAEMQAGGLETDLTFPVFDAAFAERPEYTIRQRDVLPDDFLAIQAFIQRFTTGPEKVDVVILAGGTGISAQDQTIEACRPLFEKELVGFGEIFRWLSYEQVGTAAIMSRATAGIVSCVPVFCLPGSPKAVQLALEQIILPEIAHIAYELQKE